MLSRLQKKWKVTPLRLLIILVVFSVGGSLCGWLGRWLLLQTGLEKNVLWYFLYVVLVTLLWPLCVLAISIPLGQFNFFRNYILNLGRRMKIVKKQSRINIAIFASGGGSNAEKIIEHFKDHERMYVKLVVCNKPGAGVVAIAQRNHLPVLMIERDRFYNTDAYLPELLEHNIDWIVLAGFLWKVPNALIDRFRGRMVNIHPALLPKYGGKGMYGAHVHEAVVAAGETETGITIHQVDEVYDNGDIILQARCALDANDTPATVAKKVQILEHKHFAKCVEDTIAKATLKPNTRP